MKFSPKKYSVRVKDILKSLLMAVGTAVGTIIQKIMDQSLLGVTPSFPTWKIVSMAAVAAALTYIIRKFLTDDVKLAQKTLESSHQHPAGG